MSAGIIHKKILYICPAKPVAYQVGSHFIYMGYKVHYLVDDLSHNSLLGYLFIAVLKMFRYSLL